MGLMQLFSKVYSCQQPRYERCYINCIDSNHWRKDCRHSTIDGLVACRHARTVPLMPHCCSRCCLGLMPLTMHINSRQHWTSAALCCKDQPNFAQPNLGFRFGGAQFANLTRQVLAWQRTPATRCLCSK